jgi:DNA-binding transcriptional ArsR family regulator
MLVDEHRLAIVYALGQGERSVNDLASALNIPPYKVSQHLRILKEHLLVRPRKVGQTVYYSVTNAKYIQGCTLIRQALIEQHEAQGRSLLAAELLDVVQRMPPPTTGT